jgi:hypothetical protein
MSKLRDAAEGEVVMVLDPGTYLCGQLVVVGPAVYHGVRLCQLVFPELRPENTPEADWVFASADVCRFGEEEA